MRIDVQQLPTLLYLLKLLQKIEKKNHSNKKPKKEGKGGKEIHRRRLGANNIETGLLSQKVIFLQLQD